RQCSTDERGGSNQKGVEISSFLIDVYLALQVSVCYFMVITLALQVIIIIICLVLQDIKKYVRKGERKWPIQRKC
ncbi:TPA: hypothetical protein ROX88_004443, partial [Bacillus pseudomycoides]|nr:hypothetical protein [Bacillus pseudomycoides]